MGIRSTVGEGSTFWFTLGLRQDQSEPPKPIAEVALRGLRLLHVDDNPTNRFVLREQLNHFQLRNSDCGSAAEALEALRSALAKEAVAIGFTSPFWIRRCPEWMASRSPMPSRPTRN